MSLGLDEAYRAMRSSAAVVAWPRELLRVEGPDAASYLQGQLSQDLVPLGVGESAWSLVLEPQGKLDALVRVTRTGPAEYYLDTDEGWGERLLERLQRFRLRTKASLEALGWRCLAIRGPEAMTHARGPVVTSLSWPGLSGMDVFGEHPQPPPELDEAPREAWDLLRIEAGMPAMGAELTDRTIPGEAAILGISVSFTKGCYTGQELVARIQSRGGRVPRVLRRVRANAIRVGDSLVVDGADVGEVTSAAAHPDGHTLALAYVRREVIPPAQARTPSGSVAEIEPLPQTVSGVVPLS